MRSVARWVTLVATLVACAGIGFAAYRLAGFSWDNVVDYRSPYLGPGLPPAEAGSSTASRTVLVIVDGLRLDASRRMGTLNSLRQYGADVVFTAPQPSLSYPNWTTILSGAPPYVSGVVTNWHEGLAPVETLFDTARAAGVKSVFVGPEDFEQLYGVREKTSDSFMRKWDKAYLTGTYVDAALRLAKSEDPDLLVLHLPDIDEAGHASGGASDEYAETVKRVDLDLNRLVTGLQDGSTVFVVVADHGHIDTGGHGGWEPDVVQVPGVFSGPGVKLGEMSGRLEDVAPTVASLAGVGTPRVAIGEPLFGPPPDGGNASARFWERYIAVVWDRGPLDGDTLEKRVVAAESARTSADRQERLEWGLAGIGAAILALVVIAIGSWRALVASLAGASAYFSLYNALFFLVHGNRWSLSAFNSEDLIDAWMNQRLLEAALSLLVAAVVAALVYPLLRKEPKGPSGGFLAGWLTLGPATALSVLALLGIQVAWFVWAWGIVPVWRLPDLMWAFKYDLDLVQATAVGLAALVSPLVTYLVGRYHPRTSQGRTSARAFAKKT